MTQTTDIEGKELIKQLLVEWWTKPAKEIEADELPYQTECKDLKEAETLEKKFLSIGWTARAVIIQETRIRSCPPTFVKSPRSANSLDGLHLTVRTFNGLKAARINSLQQLVTWSRVRLLKKTNLGPKSVDEISELLAYYGLTLASEAEAEADATCSCQVDGVSG